MTCATRSTLFAYSFFVFFSHVAAFSTMRNIFSSRISITGMSDRTVMRRFTSGTYFFSSCQMFSRVSVIFISLRMFLLPMIAERSTLPYGRVAFRIFAFSLRMLLAYIRSIPFSFVRAVIILSVSPVAWVWSMYASVVIISYASRIGL